jgi:hypothetical protein
MASIEKRVQTLEQEHTEFKKTIELHTAAISALVNKTTLEMLNEKYDKIFEALIAHDRLTNEQLAELRTQQIEEDGKIVGLQTETRQRFAEQDGKITALDGKVVGLQIEMRQRFAEQDGKITALDGEVVGLQTEMRQRFAELDGKIVEQQTETRQRFTGIETALAQILKRLPEKP